MSHRLSIYLILFLGLLGCKNHYLYKDTQVMMGTFVEIISPDKKAAPIVFTEIRIIEKLLSKYNPESEVSQLNKTGQLRVSPETFYVIKKSKEFWQKSAGAFDITVAPLMDLWGFTERKFSVPDEEKIRETLERVGSDKIILQEENNVIKFGVPGMRIDLGGIAKGYSLDAAAKKLRAAGIKSCLINTGGQIYALGTKFGIPWKVAIKGPRSNNFVGYLEIADQSVSTSGDYEQYFTKGKARYSHIINPKTGYPADSGVVSVTVIAPDGLTADALSTAIFVLGKEKGEELARAFPGVEVRVFER